MHDPTPDARETVFPGVYPALVVDHEAPSAPRLNQLRIRLPWLSSSDPVELWARYAGPVAGPGAGAWFLPAVGDEVLVAFEAGDLRRPYVLGGLWGGRDPAPEEPRVKGGGQPWSITTRGGLRIRLEDDPAGSRVSVVTPAGQTLVLDDAAGGSVEVRDSLGGEVRLAGGTLTVRSALDVVLEAAAVKVDAGVVDVKAGLARFSGVVQCDALIAESVISSSYTPGDGNIW